MTRYLEGRAALVTGAGRGIGRAVAHLLARHGCAVVVNDPGVGRGGEETGERPADEVVAEIAAAGGRAVANYDSVGSFDSAARMVDDCVRNFGKIDILVNVAGVLRDKMIWNMTEDDFDTVVNVHLKGTWATCHHAIRHMRQAGYGRIVNFASDAFKGNIGQSNYAAAKAGIIGLTRTIAKEAAKFGITANTICPVADTRMLMTPAVIEGRRKRLEAGEITQAEFDRAMKGRGPEHVAPIVAYLATEQAGAFSGYLYHAQKGRISTYHFGDEHRSLLKVGEDDLFTLDELVSDVPARLMNGVPPVVVQ